MLNFLRLHTEETWQNQDASGIYWCIQVRPVFVLSKMVIPNCTFSWTLNSSLRIGTSLSIIVFLALNPLLDVVLSYSWLNWIELNSDLICIKSLPPCLPASLPSCLPSSIHVFQRLLCARHYMVLVNKQTWSQKSGGGGTVSQQVNK